MSCVATLPASRNGWTNPSMSVTMDGESENTSRMFVPRRSVQRSNSSSSLASNASAASTSTVTTTSQSNGIPHSDGPHNSANPARRRPAPARGIWPASSKAEPVAGLSNARSQSVPAPSGQSAASSMSALHNGPQSVQQGAQSQQANGVGRGSSIDSVIILQLQPLNDTFARKSITIPPPPDHPVRIGRQTNQKTQPTPGNGFFDSKVLSRQHAEIWADREGKIWIRDVKSSNGTFVNGKRLSQENRDSEPHPLSQGDILELGIDIISDDQKTIVHHKVAARVEHAGPHAGATAASNIDYGDLADSASANMLQNQAARGRPQSQPQNVGNGRFTGAGAQVSNVAVPYHGKWLQPVSMEQIVKRLNAELRQARTSTTSIHSGHNVVQATKPQQKTSGPNSLERSHLPSSRSTDSLRARLTSAPPAPPPSQPLPEAPTDAMVREKLNEHPSAVPPMLRRSDTEKGKTPALGSVSSPTKADNSSQILSLVQALSTAQDELAAQGQKVKDMEVSLNSERESRRNAEERAARLETSVPSASVSASQSEGEVSARDASNSDPLISRSADSESLDSDLQRRIDLMRIEMDEMKTLMQSYRHRAETAEADSQRDRRSLSEMVERLQKKEEAERRQKKYRDTHSHIGPDGALQQDAGSDSRNEKDELERDVQDHDRALHGEVEKAKSHLHHRSVSDESNKTNGMANGAPKGPGHGISIDDLQAIGKDALTAALMEKERQERDGQNGAQTLLDDKQLSAQSLTQRTRHDQLVQSAPYASMLGVVILGMGLMAYLNGWQKIAER